MHFGGDHVQATGLCEFFGELDIGTSSGHVRGDGDSPDLPGIGDDIGFAFVSSGVEDAVVDAEGQELFSECFGGFDGGCSDEYGSVVVDQFGNLCDDGVSFVIGVQEDSRFESISDAGSVSGDGGDVHAVDLFQFPSRLHRRATHSGQVSVLAEIALDCDACGFAGGGGDGHLFLGFDGLVQSILPFAAVHDASGRFVDDHDFVVDDHVVSVFLVGELSGDGLFDVSVDAFAVDRADQRGFGGQDDTTAAGVGQEGGAAVGFVEKIDTGFEPGSGSVAPAKEANAAGVVGLSHPDDQGCPSFVDQHAVGFVDQGEVMSSLSRRFGRVGAGFGFE